MEDEKYSRLHISSYSIPHFIEMTYNYDLQLLTFILFLFFRITFFTFTLGFVSILTII